MECSCEGKTIVTDTRHAYGVIYRKRKCVECGNVFYTEETDVVETKEFIKFWKSLSRRNKNGKE